MPPPQYRWPQRCNKYTNSKVYYRISLSKDIRKIITLGGPDLLNLFLARFIVWGLANSYSQMQPRAIFTPRGIWFHIRKHDIKYTLHDHALITGLSFGASEFELSVPHDPST